MAFEQEVVMDLEQVQSEKIASPWQAAIAPALRMAAFSVIYGSAFFLLVLFLGTYVGSAGNAGSNVQDAALFISFVLYGLMSMIGLVVYYFVFKHWIFKNTSKYSYIRYSNIGGKVVIKPVVKTGFGSIVGLMWGLVWRTSLMNFVFTFIVVLVSKNFFMIVPIEIMDFYLAFVWILSSNYTDNKLAVIEDNNSSKVVFSR